MVPKRSGQVARIEPEGAELLEAYPQMAQRFRDAGWFEFLTTFQGYDERVSMEFALNFDGHEVEIGKMLMLVTEQTIAKACRLVVGGERWWKKEHVVTEFVNQFLLPEKQNPDWRRGIPRSWVRPEWHTALVVIHRYITCEGRFSLIYIYHIRILMHLNGDYPLNLPYFLLKSLTKMSKKVQSISTNAKGSLFHQVLIKTLVMSALNELQKPWNWLTESLKPVVKSNKSKKGRGRKTVKQGRDVADENPVKDESSDSKVTKKSRSKRPRWEPEHEVLPEEDVKEETESENDLIAQTAVKTEMPSTSKKNVAVKGKRKKGACVSQKPRRNSTRDTNKYRLNSKAMFNPAIKEENTIIIDDDSEEVETSTRKKAKRTPFPKKSVSKGKGKLTPPTGPVTRASTRLAKAKEMAKGISEFHEETQDYMEDSDYLPDVPGAMDSSSSEEEHSSELISKYQVKAKEPSVTLNLNETAPSEDCSGFRVEIRTDKEKIKEFQKTIKQLKKEKMQVEQWNARQQERIQSLKKKKKEQRALLKELREINFRLYWHNVVLTTKLKQKNAKASAAILS
jgi:hypothetical protein